jgi:mono/diheme cytochrome c family protein
MKWLPTARALLAMLTTLAVVTALAATEVDAKRARVNYMLNCQGCHLADGRGIGDIPEMKNFVGNFLRVPGGREYLVGVPGSANAPLNDALLAELLNWMLMEMSANELPTDWQPYTATEVASYRATTITDVDKIRAVLINRIEALQPQSN